MLLLPMLVFLWITPAFTGDLDIAAELDKALAGPKPAAEQGASTSASVPVPATVSGSPASSASLPPSRPAMADAVASPAITDRSSHLFPAIRIRVTASHHAIISSQSSGRIEQLTVRDGDRFREGQLLVRLDSSLLEIQLERAKYALQRQELLYRMAKELGELQSKGEVEVEVARMEMEQARADFQGTEKVISRARVLAPFSGRVADMFVKESQYVGEGHPLLEILDDSTLELEFIIASHWVRWFVPGYRFDVTVEETGKTYQAVLERLGGKVDPLSQSMKAYAKLLEPTPDLMEGMSGEARITPPPGVER